MMAYYASHNRKH